LPCAQPQQAIEKIDGGAAAGMAKFRSLSEILAWAARAVVYIAEDVASE
jgi:hypothetical protein